MSLAAGGPGAHNVTVSGSAVPPQMLLFASINGSEKLGSLFTYIVQLKTPDTLNLGYVSPAANLPLKPMVGKDLCVNIELDGGGKRYISGLVTAARVVGHEGRSVTYELRIEPWLKLLTHSSDYKAFQNKTVVDILDEVLADYDFPVEKRLVENYPTRTWQVQYGETDFDFIQRLMQEWGIYWWFEHSENSHTLVLADAISAHKACPDSPLVEWHQEGLKLDKEFIHTITASERLRTGQWVLDDFDFTKPRSLLANTVANPRETGHATYEHYEWPGDYFDKGEGEMLTRIRMEVHDPRLREEADFYLSVRSSLPAHQVLHQLPLVCKIGAPDDVTLLINVALNGVPLVPLTSVPAALPLRLENQYFALDMHSDAAKSMLESGCCMIYAPGTMGDLKPELFAVLRT